MPHHKTLSLANKKSRWLNQFKIALFLLITIILLLKGLYVTVIIFALLSYIINELLFADHLFYDVKQNYQYNLDCSDTESINLTNHVLQWKEHYQGKTVLLEIDLKSRLSGYIFDPGIIIHSANRTQKQFFERGLRGKRFINVSHIMESGQSGSVNLEFVHCCLSDMTATLYCFDTPELNKQKILVIAPHADDAEIAAYGVYSRTDSFICTLTAGEIEADYYYPLTGSQAEASRLKGRLRAWDSISIPLWAGLKPNRVIQLGYFCLTLKNMQQKPDNHVQSLSAELDDPAYFRLYNQLHLTTDASGQANWNHLVADIQEIIKRTEPDIIITAHPEMDPHQDHYYGTMACLEACQKSQHDPVFLLYANHHNHTDMFPFGRSGSLHSLAPEFEPASVPVSPVSFMLDKQAQYNKLMSLTMMHDLQTPLSFKKQLRKKLQHWFLGRDNYTMGYDEYFRKAVMQNELFYQVSMKQLIELFNAAQQTGEK